MKLPWSNLARQRANPVAALLSDPFTRRDGLGDDWSPRAYGDYAAMSPAVYACVNLRARNLARVRLVVHQRRDGVAMPVPESHPAQRLFDRVNPFWSRQRFWHIVEASLGLWGSAPVAIFRDARGQPRELWWLHPSRFRVVPDAAQYVKGYLYSAQGRDVAFAPDEVLWFRYPNPIEEYAGLSPLAALRLSVDMHVDAIRFNRRFFQNDATPGRVYLSVGHDLTEEQVEGLRARWEQAFKDISRAHRVAILDKGSELKTLGLPQRDMEFVESQRFTKEEICGAYGISPVLIGDVSKSTFNNFQVAKQSFWDETMLPEMQAIEAEVNASLMPLLGGGLEARFDVATISSLREDANAKASRYAKLVEAGILTINEVRAKEGLPPVAWGEGRGTN